VVSSLQFYVVVRQESQMTLTIEKDSAARKTASRGVEMFVDGGMAQV
jgi:hypothetical protein